jgi:hypothetical protein
MTLPQAKPKSHRRRLTRAEQARLDEVLIAIVAQTRPTAVCGVFRRAADIIPDLVPATDLAYGFVQRRLVRLRRAGRVPYEAITVESPLAPAGREVRP